jgi:hypothetical protein
VSDLPLYIRDDLASVGLVPAPVQLLGGHAELNEEVAGEVLRFNLATFFPPLSLCAVHRSLRSRGFRCACLDWPAINQNY